MAESVWNVFLRLSLISCPVRLVPATAPIDREFEALLSESGGILDLTYFVGDDPVEGARVGTRYDIYPNGPVAADALDALLRAMRRAGRNAAAFIARAERERMLVIEPYGGGLRLSVMRRPLVAPGVYDEPAERAVPPDMIEMAEAVIGRRVHEEDANALHERYEARLQAVIAQRSGGAAPSDFVATEPSTLEPSLLEAGAVAAATLLSPRAETAPEAPNPDLEVPAEDHRESQEKQRRPSLCHVKSPPRSCCALSVSATAASTSRAGPGCRARGSVSRRSASGRATSWRPVRSSSASSPGSPRHALGHTATTPARAAGSWR